MASKLWEKNTEVNQEIEKFTVGRDRELDLYLARYDVLGSMAHITMLESIGLLGNCIFGRHRWACACPVKRASDAMMIAMCFLMVSALEVR